MRITFTLQQGSLPPGMTLNNDGSYSGTPTQEGTYDFSIQITNDGRQATDTIHVSVVPVNYESPLEGDPGLASFRPATNAPAYYVDAVNGMDSYDGNSPAKAWRTLAKLNSITLKAGDVVRLARGSVWNETLYFESTELGTSSAPIIVEAYGSGVAPTISTTYPTAVHIGSSYITILDLRVCDAQWGFDIRREAQYVVLAGNEVINTSIGIYADGSGHRFLSNYIHDLRMIHNNPRDPNDYYGAVGVIFVGSNMEAAWNRLVNCIAPIYDFEVSGGAFQSYGSQPVQHIHIHHNLANNVNSFMDLYSGTDDLVIAHNLIINSRRGLCFQFDDVSGSVNTYSGVRFENNTVLSDPRVTKEAVFYFASNHVGQLLPGNSMIIRNNIIGSNMRLCHNPEALGANLTHDHNLYNFTSGGSLGTLTLDPTEKTGDPKFVDPSKTDFRLMPGSPAIDVGSAALYNYDLDNTAIPNGTSPDMGAYERY
ncbi:MAG: putative Ig domain-containing protein [Verrucomicrobia bacterium]|nr:putative Ig domain-containing protein [Verrucomicrobiota bacterium]